MKPINNLDQLLATMTPVLNDGVYVFASLPNQSALPANQVVASIREAEGLSVVVSEQTAQDYGLNANFRAAWITLTVHSDLAAVGLTAAFAKALGTANISCNVVAGFYHDHLFVPYDQADAALKALWQLQRDAGGTL